MKPLILSRLGWLGRLTPIAIALTLFSVFTLSRLEVCAAESVSDKVGAVTSDAGKQVNEAAKAAESKIQELWRRIDEKRLTNRTPDQIVAWFIMGVLASLLIQQFSKLNKVATLLFGLAGALIGGMIANVVQLDLGMGPVLIRYEDLLASLVGSGVIVLVARWLASRKSAKP